MNEQMRQFVDGAFCINLDRRVDRWERSLSQFRAFGLDVQRLQGIEGRALPPHIHPPTRSWGWSPGAHGSLLSHMRAVETARDAGMKGVWVWEDDIRIRPWFHQATRDFLSNVPDDWDMLWFGGKVVMGKHSVAPHVYRPIFMYYSLSYMVRDKAYDLFLSALSRKGAWADMVMGGLFSQLNCYTMYPRPVRQFSRSDSDNLNRGAIPYRHPLVAHALSIPGWMSENELQWLSDTASTRKRVLELGAWKGRSTLALCAAPGRVLTLDHWRGDDHPNGLHRQARDRPGSVKEEFTRNLWGRLASGQLTAVDIDLRSPDVGKHIQRVLGSPDFCFIDANHVAPHPSLDIELCLHHLDTGGIIAGHDYHPGVWDDVVSAVDRAFGSDVQRGPDTIWWAVKKEPAGA